MGAAKYTSWAQQSTPFGLTVRTLFHPLTEDSILIRLAMFALVSVGLHAGADQIDDKVFLLINAVDGVIDQVLAKLITSVGGFLTWPEQRIQQLAFRAIDYFSLAKKITASQYLALACELLAVGMLAVPLLFQPAQSSSEGYRQFTHRWWSDPSFARYGVPLAVAAASLSGLLIVTTTAQSSAYPQFLSWTAQSGLSKIITQILGALCLIGVFWFFFIRCFMQVLLRIDRRARNDILNMVSKRRRRLRGLWRCLIALPVALLGFSSAPSLLETIKAIVSN